MSDGDGKAGHACPLNVQLTLATFGEQFLRLIVESSRCAAEQLLETGAVTMAELWLIFFSIGGNAEQLELEAYIFGMTSISPFDELMLTVAVAQLQNN